MHREVLQLSDCDVSLCMRRGREKNIQMEESHLYSLAVRIPVEIPVRQVSKAVHRAVWKKRAYVQNCLEEAHGGMHFLSTNVVRVPGSNQWGRSASQDTKTEQQAFLFAMSCFFY